MIIEQILIQSVTWLIIINGWILVNRQNNNREKRKEIRSLIDKVQNLLDEIEKDAIMYHTNQVSDELSFKIRRNLNQNLQNKLKVLQIRHLNTKQCSSLHKKLRQAVTLKNFDTAEFQPQTLSSDIIKEVWIAKDKLSQELEECFARDYDN